VNPFSLSVYIYLHTHKQTQTHIHRSIALTRERDRASQAPASGVATPPCRRNRTFARASAMTEAVDIPRSPENMDGKVYYDVVHFRYLWMYMGIHACLCIYYRSGYK